jgi:hypothetical protein
MLLLAEVAADSVATVAQALRQTYVEVVVVFMMVDPLQEAQVVVVVHKEAEAHRTAQHW